MKKALSILLMLVLVLGAGAVSAVVTADEGAGDGPILALLAGLLRLGLATPTGFFLAGHRAQASLEC